MCRSEVGFDPGNAFFGALSSAERPLSSRHVAFATSPGAGLVYYHLATQQSSQAQRGAAARRPSPSRRAADETNDDPLPANGGTNVP